MMHLGVARRFKPRLSAKVASLYPMSFYFDPRGPYPLVCMHVHDLLLKPILQCLSTEHAHGGCLLCSMYLGFAFSALCDGAHGLKEEKETFDQGHQQEPQHTFLIVHPFPHVCAIHWQAVILTMKLYSPCAAHLTAASLSLVLSDCV